MAQKKTRAAIALVLAGAAAALIFAHSPQSALFMLVAGVAAVLVLRHPEAPSPPPIDGDGEDRDAVNDLIEALDEPTLVLAGNKVVRANSAARAVLGAHVLGQDVRLAVRHPAAGRRLGESTDSGETETQIRLGGSKERRDGR